MEEVLDNIQWFDQQEILHGRKYPSLGLQRRGTATLNKAAMEALGNPPALVVGYVPGKHAIAFKGTQEGAKGALSIRNVGKSSTVLFSLVPFAEKHKIRHDEARQYAGQLVGGLLLFDLDQTD
jgi:hypothetical protein